MKILLFCTVNITRPIEAGVAKKVRAQRKVLLDAGHTVYLACRANESDMYVLSAADEVIKKYDLNSTSKFNRDKAITNFVHEFAVNNHIDLLYARYGTFSLNAYKLYNRLHKKGIIVLLEIATYPLNQRWNVVKQSLKSHDYKSALIWIYSNTIGSLGMQLFKKCVNRIVNNNGFEIIWGIPVLPISNGIDVSSIPDKPRHFAEGNDIRVMSVANIANWHGFDRFIRGMASYYQQPHEYNIYFEVAGPGAEAEVLKKLAESLGISQYVKFDGPLVGEKLDDLFHRSDLGISVLGVHRVNMKQCDSLKAREFCARRLPFVTEEAEIQYKGQPFAMCAPTDDNPIDIFKVVEFYKSIVNNPAILDKMRLFAEEKCDWKYAMRNVVDYIDHINK